LYRQPLYYKGMVRRAKKAAKGSAVIVAGAGRSSFEEPGEQPTPVPATGSASKAEPEVSHSQDEIAMVRRATEVLGIDHVARWMQSKIPSLGNQTPYALVKTEDGRKQVERVLLKIEHGVY
jgi:hypothetical protein